MNPDQQVRVAATVGAPDPAPVVRWLQERLKARRMQHHVTAAPPPQPIITTRRRR
ncbi:MAG: hypothetical protein LBF16_09845 [Pseudomonadales bacterium]|nr:hypothetical protein [Pseudomonadales bacterium]